MEFSSRC